MSDCLGVAFWLTAFFCFYVAWWLLPLLLGMFFGFYAVAWGVFWFLYLKGSVMNVVMRNWATSIPALGVMLVAIGNSLVAAFDNDPSTVVDANTIFVSVGFFFTSIVGLAARQAGNGSDSSLVSKYEAKGG